MSAPFLAEIRIWGCTFAPNGWAQCNGQLMPLSQNTALFSLLGTTYGGDGKSTFGLPNLGGNVPIHVGGDQPGKGLSTYDLGQSAGVPDYTLPETEMAIHSHTLRGNFNTADVNDPSPARSLAGSGTGFLYQSDTSSNLTPMSGQALGSMGNSQPHNNMMPYLPLNFCIALQGVFPPRG
jgi:microcystin-dependent protein